MILARHLGALVLLCTAVTGVVAQTSGGVGYVDNDGVVVRYQGGFDQAVQAAQKNAGKALSSWKTCMSGLDLGKAFQLSPYEYQRYRQNPAPYCGQQPADRSDQAGNFSLRELVWSPTGTKIGRTLANFTFSNPSETRIPLQEPLSGKCVAFFDANNNIVPIRSAGRGGDAYTFTNPFKPLNGDLKSQESEVIRIEAAINSAQQELANKRELVASQLSVFESFGGRLGPIPPSGDGRLYTVAENRARREPLECRMPAQSPIPPRPTNIMSAAEVNFQANGSCFDLLRRRHSTANTPNAVANAIAGVDRTDSIFRDYTAWKKGRQASCSLVNVDTNDYGIRMICGGFSDIACYDAMRSAFAQCHAAVTRSCGGASDAYDRMVEEIRAAPRQKYQQCTNLGDGIRAAQSDAARLEGETIPSLQAQYAAASQRLAELRTRPAEQAQAMPIANARCGG